MVERKHNLLKPAGKRYTLPDGTLRTSSVRKPFAAIAKKMPGGRVKPVISMFPDMPYYGFLLIGAAEPVINSGFSKDGSVVIQENEVFEDSPKSGSYPPHTPIETSTRRIYFDDWYVFEQSLWLKSMPLIQYNYTGSQGPCGQREFYLPSRSYAHVDQKMYCLRDYDTAGNPEILGYTQACKRDSGTDFRYRSYAFRIYGEIRNTAYYHDYEPYPISYLDSASIRMTLWPYDEDGGYFLYQEQVKPYITLSNKIDTNHSTRYKVVGPRSYREYWDYEGDEKNFFEYSKPTRTVHFAQSDNSESNIGWTPVGVLAGKIIEPTRSCIYKQGEPAAGRAGQGFCKLDHKVLYYKIPIRTATFDSQLSNPPYNIVYKPGDIIIEEITGGSQNYRSYKCIQRDYNLEKFKSLAERPFYYTQIWQGLREYGYHESGLNDITQGHCPYGNAWDEYFNTATNEQIESYVKALYF